MGRQKSQDRQSNTKEEQQNWETQITWFLRLTIKLSNKDNVVLMKE